MSPKLFTSATAFVVFLSCYICLQPHSVSCEIEGSETAVREGVVLRNPRFYDSNVNGMHVKVESFDPLPAQESYLVSANNELGVVAPQPDPVRTYVVQNAAFGDTYSNYTVNSTEQVMFMYGYTEYNQTTAIRIRVSCAGAEENFPVMFVARQQERVLSWQVPLELGDSYKYWSVSRTLCPVDKNHRKHISKDQLIYVTVSSMSNESRGFNLTTVRLPDFALEHGKPRSTNLSASQPQYYMYTFPKDVSTILLTVTSSSHHCMTVSVQKIKCPVYDLDTNVEFEGKHQTMSTRAAMFLDKGDYEDQEGFYIVLVMKPDDHVCSGELRAKKIVPAGEVIEEKKFITINIEKTISSSQYYRATFAAVGVFLGFYFIAFIIGVVFAGCGLHKGLDDLTDEERGTCMQLETSKPTPAATLQIHINPNFQRANPRRLREVSPGHSTQADENNFLNRTNARGGYGTLVGQENREQELTSAGNSDRRQRSSDSSSEELDENNIDFLPDAEEEKEVFRTKTAVFVSDLARKGRKKLSKTYKLYHWNLLTISIFYGLPVIQLVITYQTVSTATGNQDLCYYNFECAHPLKNYLSSFNNVFSNIGYVMLGLLFILIVYRRDVLHKKVIKDHGELEKLYGIPQHFGLFYAMGLALLMEGVMSACYHVCPNYSNFQFDTSFMYIIACLCMLKIYQTRHPDINAKAHTAYFTMAVVIFIAVLGVVYGTNIFWIFYALIHMLLTLVVTAQVYYMGQWKIDRHIFRRLFLVMVSDCKRCACRPVYFDRFVILFIGNIVNWAFALYGAIKQPSDFASYLLAIFIGNLLLYCIFYIIMKLLNNERLSLLAAAVILTSVLTWAGSLYFFFQHLTSWQDTPAGSRAGNRKCIVMEFYDSHDVWHFLSAISLFFSFMILLILDDDLSQKRRDKIPVF